MGPLPKEWELIDHARTMRNAPTEPEKRLWRHLSRSQLGYKFRRQATLAPFIVDFFCPAYGLIVEIDGDTHSLETDARRDALLAERGFKTIRFTNSDVMTNMEGVLTAILETVRSQPLRWPHPNPVGRSPRAGIAAGNPSTMPGAWLTPIDRPTPEGEGLTGSRRS